MPYSSLLCCGPHLTLPPLTLTISAAEGLGEGLVQPAEVGEGSAGAASPAGATKPGNGVAGQLPEQLAAAGGSGSPQHGSGAGNNGRTHPGAAGGSQAAPAVAVKQEPADGPAAGELPTGNGVPSEPEQPESKSVLSCIWGTMPHRKQQPDAAEEPKQQQAQQQAQQQQQQQQQQQPANGIVADRAAAAVQLPPKPAQQAAAPSNGAAAPMQQPANGKLAEQPSQGAASEQCLTGQTGAVAAAIQRQIASLQHVLASDSQQQQLGEGGEPGQPSADSPQELATAAQTIAIDPGNGLLGRKRSFGELSQGSGEATHPSSRPRHSDSGGTAGGSQDSGGSGGMCVLGDACVRACVPNWLHLELLSCAMQP